MSTALFTDAINFFWKLIQTQTVRKDLQLFPICSIFPPYSVCGFYRIFIPKKKIINENPWNVDFQMCQTFPDRWSHYKLIYLEPEKKKETNDPICFQVWLYQIKKYLLFIFGTTFFGNLMKLLYHLAGII